MTKFDDPEKAFEHSENWKRLPVPFLVLGLGIRFLRIYDD